MLLAEHLPAELPATVLVVLHIGANSSTLPALLSDAGRVPAAHAIDGEPLARGRIAIAPPDHHLLIKDGKLRLSRGPKEHFTRPAIDPLFRSAAIECGSRVMGVVLTGNLDDGTSGLQAIKQRGGLALVQDPATADAPAMPASALQYVAVDYCLPLESLARKLFGLAQEPAPEAAPPSLELLQEQAPWTGTVNAMDDLRHVATPSPLVCPDCGGGLWEINGSRPPRFRCHTGHGYSLKTLHSAMQDTTEASLWAAERALQAKAAVSRRLAEEWRRTELDSAALEEERDAERQERNANELRDLIEKT